MVMSTRREQARELRRQGKSVKEIARLMGISQSSVSVWVRDVELSKEVLEELRQRKRGLGKRTLETLAEQEEQRNLHLSYQQVGRIKAREKDWLHYAGCLLYWAEGAKGRNFINLTHPDPHLMALFVRFLRESLHIPTDMIDVHLYVSTEDKEAQRKIEREWLTALNLPAVKKVHIKPSRTSCGIQVHKTEMLQHIYGAIQEYGGFENPDWLE
jgi:predicted transcriptional regulator